MFRFREVNERFDEGAIRRGTANDNRERKDPEYEKMLREKMRELNKCFKSQYEYDEETGMWIKK